MASNGVRKLLDNLLTSMRIAGDPVRVFVAWISDLRTEQAQGWDWKHVAQNFINAKLLLMAEAQLNARPATMSVIMDTDVQVFPGWGRYLASCVQGISGPDVCFFAQPWHTFEVANGGVIVLRVKSAASSAFVHSSLAWFQSMEAHGRVFPGAEQLVFNSIIRRVKQERTAHSLRWGIYHPAFARVGLGIVDSHLNLRLHHATGTANLEDKLRSLSKAAAEVALARSLCPVGGQQCATSDFGHGSQVQGPAIQPCFFVYDADPHFGPFPNCWRENTWFTSGERQIEHMRFQRRKHVLMNNDAETPLVLAAWMDDTLDASAREYVAVHCLKAGQGSVIL